MTTQSSAGQALREMLDALDAAHDEPDDRARAELLTGVARAAAAATVPFGQLPDLVEELRDEYADDVEASAKVIREARKAAIFVLVHEIEKWEAHQFIAGSPRPEPQMTDASAVATRKSKSVRDLARSGKRSIVFPRISQPTLGWDLQLAAIPESEGMFKLEAKLYGRVSVKSRSTEKPRLTREWVARFSLSGQPRGAEQLNDAWRMEEPVMFEELANVTVAIETA